MPEEVLRFRFQGEGGVYEIMAARRDGQVRLLCNCPAARRHSYAACSHRIELLMGEADKVIDGDLAALGRFIHGTDLEKAKDAWLALDHAKDVATKNAREAKDQLYFVMGYDPWEKPDRAAESRFVVTERATGQEVGEVTAVAKMWGIPKPDAPDGAGDH